MGKSRLKIIVGALIALVVVIACSEKSANPPGNYNNGKISFVNGGNYAITLGKMTQKRGSESMTITLNRTLGTGGDMLLPNIIDGGYIFHGGDRVTVKYTSSRHNGYGAPLFTNSVFIRVNGQAIVRIKGDSGEYDIGGN